MRIKLDELKKALAIKLLGHAEKTCPMERRNEGNGRFLVYEGDKGLEGVLFDSNREHYRQVEGFDTVKSTYQKENSVLLYKNPNEEDKKHLVALLKLVASAEYGANLWRDINLYQNQMPGFWRFFSALRPLTLELKDLLEQFKPEELKTEDDAWVKHLLETLRARINELLEMVRKLQQDYMSLQQENTRLRKQVDAGKISKQHAQQLIQQQTELLIASKNELVKEMEGLKEENTVLLEQTESLKQSLDSTHNENKILREQLLTLLDKIENDTQKSEKMLTQFNKTERLDALSSTNSSAPTVQELNAQYKRYRQQSGPSTSHRSHGFWKKSTSCDDLFSNRNHTPSFP
ncbi:MULTISPECIES: hypothetical protein [unclassified Legionella]|uniref:hypothetical protein n=1 Tax=unclassified Legionella TaxID=2622702 RepID=UPI001056002E|nr:MULTISPECIES: hypothetical protein [unclassified Legionella]MDI9817960.1 hypothetical protein [Legionella sp. PL877]